MALSDTKVRTVKAKEKPFKVADERGLFLLVQPTGGKLWRLKYRIDGKERLLSLGTPRYIRLSQKWLGLFLFSP